MIYQLVTVVMALIPLIFGHGDDYGLRKGPILDTECTIIITKWKKE